jgi:hypothetical protein
VAAITHKNWRTVLLPLPVRFRRGAGLIEWMGCLALLAAAVGLASAGEPEYTYERLRLPEMVAFNPPLLTECVVLFGSTLVAAAVDQVLGRRRPAKRPSGGLAGASR